MSRVDVIVPCYKYAHFLRECVTSVLSQSHRDVRVLVIDDASPDDTESVAGGLAMEDGRVEYRRHRVNLGHIATYNEGLEWAAGEYTLLLSADDLLTPGALSRAVRLMDEHPEVGMTFGKVMVVTTGGTLPVDEAPDRCESRIIPREEFVHSFCEAGYNHIKSPTVIARTAVHKRAGFYRQDLPHSGDLEMWLRFGALAPVGHIDAFQAVYRRHDSNMHRGYMAVRDHEQARLAFEVFFSTFGKELHGPDGLHELARQRQAERAFWESYYAFERGEVTPCREILEFAVTTWPGVKALRSYRRLHWKLAVGAGVWSRVRPLWDRLSVRMPA